ncbi:DUF6881 domain-containing protein [Roseibium sp.]|uniref:DUF6881 domain-containing protein n=1 Tax=Roseibium sp. TaxID=1936156 RepID=UPI003D096906
MAMRYLKVVSVHNNPDHPNICYYEDDENEFLRTRRVMEIFPDGSFGMATGEFEFGRTFLPIEGSISFEEIAAEKDIYPFVISQDEFEQIWSKLIQRMLAEK